MNNQATMEKMNSMKLFGMQRAFAAALETREAQRLTSDELINYLIETEFNFRQNIRMGNAVKNAKFRCPASIEGINFAQARDLDKNMVMRLFDCAFVDKKENILVTGPTGVGKSYIASAIGHHACTMGYKVRYFNTGKLFTALKMSKADNSYLREINRIEKQDILILDDFGLHPIDAFNRVALLEIIEDRHGKSSTIIASQVPVKEWHGLMGESTVADAIMDRIVHNSHRIELQGQSMRKIKNN